MQQQPQQILQQIEQQIQQQLQQLQQIMKKLYNIYQQYYQVLKLQLQPQQLVQILEQQIRLLEIRLDSIRLSKQIFIVILLHISIDKINENLNKIDNQINVHNLDLQQILQQQQPQQQQ